MSYKKTNWVDDSTPLNAKNLNNMEEGIDQAHKSTINGKNITSNPVLTAEDVGALPDTTSIPLTLKGTVISKNSDFAEVAEWADGNPDGEDRSGYFVCANVPLEGIVMKKATSNDDVKGVSILTPAFAGNYTKDKVDDNGNLLPKYSYVAIIGFVPVRDNGACTVDGELCSRCMPDDNGCAIPSSNNMGYQVVNRIDKDRILIIIEPNADMVQRIKARITQLQEEIADSVQSLQTLIEEQKSSVEARMKSIEDDITESNESTDERFDKLEDPTNVDQSYDSESAKPQSGVAVHEAIKTEVGEISSTGEYGLEIDDGYLKVVTATQDDITDKTDKPISALNLDFAVKSVTNQEYDPTSTQPQSGIAMEQALHNFSTVGKSTEENGEVFNDYATNIASAQFAHAEGEGNIATAQGAHAEGRFNTVEGKGSHAEGRDNIVKGSYSHVEGSGCSVSEIAHRAHAEGSTTQANEYAAHAEGSGTKADGYASHAEGSTTQANGYASHAEGYQTIAKVDSAHSEGKLTEANGANSHAEGEGTKADAEAAHAEGKQTVASGTAAHAEGLETNATGKCSHTEGYFNTASAECTHAEGVHNKATVYCAHVEGGYNEANNLYTHAEGGYTEANGQYSHSEGLKTIAEGNNSHAEGNETVASGSSSHSEGYQTEASGTHSHASGTGTKATDDSQFAVGKYNEESDALFVVGNGTSDTERSNAFTVLKDGTARILEQGQTDNSVATKKYVDDSIKNVVAGDVTKFLSDYVVEQGTYATDGTTNFVWTYRKWASGLAEMWMRCPMTGLQFNRDLPFTLIDNSFAAAHINQYTGIAYTPPISLGAEVERVQVSQGFDQIKITASEEPTDGYRFLISISIVGRWK